MSGQRRKIDIGQEISAVELLRQEEQTLIGLLKQPLPSILNYKLILAGDGGVGKTCIANAIQGVKFQEQYIITLGCQFSIVDISLPFLKTHVYAQIWDLAGQPHFSQVRKNFYAGAHIAIVVGDLTNPSTFKTIPDWISEALDNSGATIPILILGNKIDLAKNNPRALNREKINYLLNFKKMKTDIDDNSLIYLSTSAKTGFNIKEVFQLAMIKALIWHKEN